jgi:amino acid transporter
LNVVITYWSDKIPLAAICAACIVLYAIINLFAVRWYGEAEFWLSSGKIILIFMLFSFTFMYVLKSDFDHLELTISQHYGWWQPKTRRVWL